MTAARRSWITTFADEALLSDLRAAARDYHAEVDSCDPESCAHPEPMLYATDLPDWIEERVKTEQRKPLHLRPAGQPNRLREGELRVGLDLAAAG